MKSKSKPSRRLSQLSAVTAENRRLHETVSQYQRDINALRERLSLKQASRSEFQQRHEASVLRQVILARAGRMSHSASTIAGYLLTVMGPEDYKLACKVALDVAGLIDKAIREVIHEAMRKASDR